MVGENGATEVVGAEVVAEIPTAPEVGAAMIPMGGTALAVTPQVPASDLVARLGVIKEAMDTAMKADVDYGAIPGTGGKPTLLKPGAEKLSVLFQLDIQIADEKEWEEDHHLTVTATAIVFHAPTGARLGSGEGICSTRERKYAYRKGERICPHCKEPAVIKGKKEFGGGWLCWNKPERGKNGCGAKWPDGSPEIEGQVVGDIPNPDLPDLWNTVLKMARKRARVDAVLAVTGASALFTQDVEDGNETAGSQEFHKAVKEAGSGEQRPLHVDGATAGRIGKGITALGLAQSDINLILGALGADGLRGTTGADVRQAVEALTPDQGATFEARLEVIASEREPSAPQGGGEGDGE
jgi:hypothetical protein